MVLLPVSHDVIKYCKDLVFHYIEHGILGYDFVYDIDIYMFQVLPLLPWTLELSNIKDCNVFHPSLPYDLTH